MYVRHLKMKKRKPAKYEVQLFVDDNMDLSLMLKGTHTFLMFKKFQWITFVHTKVAWFIITPCSKPWCQFLACIHWNVIYVLLVFFGYGIANDLVCKLNRKGLIKNEKKWIISCMESMGWVGSKPIARGRSRCNC